MKTQSSYVFHPATTWPQRYSIVAQLRRAGFSADISMDQLVTDAIPAQLKMELGSGLFFTPWLSAVGPQRAQLGVNLTSDPVWVEESPYVRGLYLIVGRAIFKNPDGTDYTAEAYLSAGTRRMADEMAAEHNATIKTTEPLHKINPS